MTSRRTRSRTCPRTGSRRRRTASHNDQTTRHRPPSPLRGTRQGSGELAVTFSESLGATVNLGSLHVRESGSTTGGFALTGSTHAVSGATATFTLTQTQQTALAALTTPQLDIDADAVSDLSDNGIVAAQDGAITIDDTTPPTFSSAGYATGSGELAVTFSEGIGPTVNLAGLHVRESGSSTGGFALTGAAHAVSGETVTFTLTPSQQASFAALTTPQLDIEADAVSDLSENGIEAAPDLAITIDDTAPPHLLLCGVHDRGAGSSR